MTRTKRRHLQRLKSLLLAATIAVAVSPVVKAADLSGTHDEMKITELSTGAVRVKLIFDLNGWNRGDTHKVLHFCPPGVEMTIPGFAILKRPAWPDAQGLRKYIRLTQIRNMVEKGNQGVSWYIRNDGPSVGPVRLEISFIAKRVVEPTE